MPDIERLISDMTLDEKVDLVSGASAWRSNAIPRLGIPRLKMSDGPNGVRGDGGRDARSTAFPVGVCLAATFDPELLEELGAAIAVEARDKAVDVVLGPTINIHRTPLGGRNFECYSEDPFLSGELASAFVRGVQGHAVAACLKHFVCNDSEFERHSISVDVDERPLREIYLRPFEKAVRQAGPWSVMAAYNRINGVFACSHGELLNGVLKGEWGFDGYVVSDWFAALETVPNALGGLDMEMPGPPVTWGGALREAVASGAVPEATLDDKVRRILRTLERTGKFDNPKQGEDTGAQYRKLARRVIGPRAKVRMRYANGTELRLELDGDWGPGLGAIFVGEKGKIEINRNKIASNPKELTQSPDNPGPNKKLETQYHIENWVECIKTRRRCNADIEYGQRSTTLCYLVNIARAVGDVGRRLHWDPKSERFTNCEEGNAMLSRPRRKGYELPKLG